MKKGIVVIGGPTACGKTAVSVEVCRRIGGEVISADSMQVYKYMDIGTAKVREDEKKGIRHFLVDEIEPFDDYSIAVFQKKAVKYIDEIWERGHIPVVAGGTGFYINGLIYGNDFTAGAGKNAEIRQRLEAELERVGRQAMFERLVKADPEYGATTHPNNVKRVLRALEYFEETGERFSAYNERERKREPFYNSRIFVLNMERKKLYERIDRRVDAMMEEGLVDEVRRLLEMGVKRESTAMQGLGYKEIAAYLMGETTLEEAVYILKRDTRHFAKRQLTWFKHQCPDAVWINIDEFEGVGGTADFIAERVDL